MSNRNLLEILVVLEIIFIVLFMLIPLPVIIVDILIGLNLLYTFIILIFVLMVKKITKIFLLPSLVLISLLITPGINISAFIVIFSKGQDFNGWLICTINNLIAGSGVPEKYIDSFFATLIVSTIMFMIIIKIVVYLPEVAARVRLDVMAVSNMVIDAELTSEMITEDEAIEKKNNLQKEVDFYLALDGVSKFISGNAKLNIWFIVIIIVGGTAVDYLYRNIPIIDALKTYTCLSAGSWFLFSLPLLIIATGVGIAVTRSYC